MAAAIAPLTFGSALPVPQLQCETDGGLETAPLAAEVSFGS